MGDSLEVLMGRIVRLWPLLVFALLFAGCVGGATKTAEQQQEVAEEIEAILTQPLAQDEYVQGDRCISTYQYHSVEVLDNQHVLFKGRGKKLWLNTLRTRCVGLRRRDLLKFELRGSQLCNLDDFVAISQSLFVGMETSAKCSLGDFAPVTAEQVALIKATMEKKPN